MHSEREDAQLLDDSIGIGGHIFLDFQVVAAFVVLHSGWRQSHHYEIWKLIEQSAAILLKIESKISLICQSSRQIIT